MKVLSRVVVALVAMLALPVQAMQLDPDGQGEILIYPYFSAQDSEGNDFNTYLSVVNSSPDAKALRVRFREGRNGHELMSFNLLLEPQGTWTAVVVPRTGGAGFITTDLSCTAPVPVSSVPLTGVCARYPEHTPR